MIKFVYSKDSGPFLYKIYARHICSVVVLVVSRQYTLYGKLIQSS